MHIYKSPTTYCNNYYQALKTQKTHKKKQTIKSPLLHNKKEIADYAISFSMTRTGFEPVLPP